MKFPPDEVFHSSELKFVVCQQESEVGSAVGMYFISSGYIYELNSITNK
jgi:hypothetical protein